MYVLSSPLYSSTCVNPDPTRDSRWKADRITDWPVNICISCVAF